MAKLKRVIRKVAPASASAFDDQFWPVLVAFIVLGAFLEGAALGYLRYDDPRWWANRLLVMAAIPVVLGVGVAVTLLVNSRLVKRAMQLAIVASITIHVLLMIVSLKYSIFDKPKSPQKSQEGIVQKKQPVTIPDYAKPQLKRERQQHDFEKPVETTTPAPKPEEIAKEEPSPENLPAKPQPIPVPEVQPTVQPSAVQRTTPSETAARQADTESKLSRQTTQAQPRSGSPVAAPQVAPATAKPSEKVAAKSSAVERQSTESPQTARAKPEVEPTTPVERPTTSIAKRQTEDAPEAKTAAAMPTLPRKLNTPAALPRAETPLAESPSAAKQTEPTEARPSTVAAVKQPTASPVTPAKPAEAAPEKPTEITAQPQKRQSPAEAQPLVAEAPAATPSPTSRTTTRASVVPSPTDVATPSKAPSESPKQPTLQAAQTGAVQRTTTDMAVARPTPAPEPTPVIERSAVATAQRAQASDTPAAQPTPTVAASASRRPSASPAAAANSSAQAADSAIAKSASPSGTAQARATNVSKQATTGPAAAAANVTAEVAGTNTAAPTAGPAATRQPRADQAPTVAQGGSSAPNRRESTAALPGAVTSTAEAVAAQGTVKSADQQPRPASSNVARQASNSPLATGSRQPLEAPSASTATQLAGAMAQRAETSSAPSIRPEADPGRSPARSARPSATASSPTAIESPAVAQSEQGSGQPSVQPSRMALSKAQGGTAGAGRSINLDRAMPAADSPAQVASGAAQRASASQNSAPGPALAPSEPARISRSQAGAAAPSSTLAATPVEFATDSGAAQPGQTSASASAAVARTSANAPAGPISAAKGSVEVDLGPTRVVSEGGAGRASGGGQPNLNFETQSREIARKAGGGSPQMSLAAAEVAEVPSAPSATGGGKPAADVNPSATAIARSDAGGTASVSGGPATADVRGPTAESSTAEQVAAAALTRTERAEAAAGTAEAGGGDPTLDEEERKRRLARAALAGGAPAPATAITAAEAPASVPAGEPGGGKPAKIEAGPATAVAARSTEGGGAPTPAGPSAKAEVGPPAETGGGEQVAATPAIGRAEAASATPGAPAAGGGTGSPARSATGPALTANTQAAQVSIEGLPSSGGAPDGAPVASQGAVATRTSGGAPGPAVSGPVGAAHGEAVVDVPSGSVPGVAIGPRQASSVNMQGPATSDALVSGGPAKRAAALNLPTGASAEDAVNIPIVNVSTDAKPDMSELAGGGAVGPMNRVASGGRVVEIGKVEGPGGLGADYTPDVGIAARQASRESQNVQLSTARFVRSEVGGPLAANTSAVVSADPFRGRPTGDSGKNPGGPQGSPSPQTEEAIELGLQFLVRHQSPDGRWSLNHFASGRPGYENEKAALNSDTAATGLALLAFQGAGYNHREHKHRETVLGGLEWLLKHQKEDGDLYVPLDDESSRSVWLYSHSIATLALCEAYGMTQDPALKEPSQKALNFIVKAQNPERGGWRYSPTQGADTSVTGWMMMALKSGELANLEVPSDTYVKIQKWLDSAQASNNEKHLYRYNPSAPNTKEQSHGRVPSKTMTAVGLLMRLYSGWKRDNPNMIAGADYLKQRLPSHGSQRENERDTYYWYYATQVMFHMGGEHWKAWNDKLHPLLVNSQVKQGPMAGSWNPLLPVPDRWAPHAGRLYVTTMNLLSLEVYYRHLPLYEDTAK